MPYDHNDVESLPKNVQKFDEHHRKMWSEIWNNAYKQHGSEERAFATANGVLKKRLGHSTPTEDANGATPKSIDLEIVAGAGDMELPVYDPSDAQGLNDFISKAIGLDIEVK